MSMDKTAKKLVKPEEVILWVPGDLTIDSIGLGWDNIAMRGYSYNYLDVDIPAMRDYMIVNYKSNNLEMKRRENNSWKTKTVNPKTVSLLTCGEDTRWAWDKELEVVHVYIAHETVSNMANQVFDYDIANIRIPDEIGVEDETLPVLSSLLEQELRNGGLGGNLFVESIKNQIALHLLRRYAKLEFKEGFCKTGFNLVQRNLLVDFIQQNLSEKICLEDLSILIGISVPHLMRKFKVDFGTSPAAYIMEQRIQLAKKLLISRKDMPIKVIASESGFFDQSHMNRVFHKFFKKTPAEIRQELSKITQIQIG
ncbi:helix-turn-helix domain-containing protein [Acinetobacter sp. ANC 4173]|uniref:helix-turn-helix domain-containing protein n=1 Tax=Acinetobacter sp. ANC 4173 TaxID=2529837 RepID=UPI0013F1708B|nr:AraC family transcriptional regulator [Acinetobacter sp. ANC 4173]